ncbi:ADP-dependent glucokinase [Schistocerca cancellata]|uniref:ADP-dependent glucokinase n=1 Tax=Schistocerca cancellata TaxID=274614 RepID=UPI0021189E6F|nr:ADP-dependent glucokinase [Schistocerca cancellata]
MGNFLKYCSFISLLVLLYSLYVRREAGDELQTRLNSVLEGLVKAEKQFSLNQHPKVALGYGACQDVFVDARLLLTYDSIAEKPEHFSDIRSRDELLRSYAYFFRHGAAAERFVSNASLFEELVQAASALEGTRYALGGNAPVMASRFYYEGCEVVLAARMSLSLMRSLPEDVKVYGGEISRDDVHLILEYKAGEVWGKYSSPRANRFIVHNDVTNPTLSSMEGFDEVLDSFEPDLLVISGLQMMDNYPFEFGERMQLLARVREQMRSRPASTKVHFEMASFSEPKMLHDLAMYIIPFADSLGMNEQELTNLQHILQFGNISLVSDSNPRVATVLDQMRHVFRLVLSKGKGFRGNRPLTRLHVHTLAYQAVMTVKGSPWRNTMAAAAKASLTAHRHVCASEEVDIGKAMLIMDESFSTSVAPGSRRVPLDVEKPVSCWEEMLGEDDVSRDDLPVPPVPVEICVAPVLVCTRAHQTAGGGDNISSAGLVLQI